MLKPLMSRVSGVLVIWLLIFAVAGSFTLSVKAQSLTLSPTSFSTSSLKLPGGLVIHSSPTLADLTGDGIPEVLIGTTAKNGASGNRPNRPMYLVAVRGNNTNLWSTAVDAPINSSPSVADIDGDGQPEVVVTTGGDVEDRRRQGSLMVFDRNGALRWRVATIDFSPRDGYPDGAFSSPTLCDVEGDGTMEIIFGGWDHQIYMFNHDGTPRWQNLNLPPGMTPRPGYHNADTVWSTAACADLNGDGQQEVIIGADISAGGILPDGTRPNSGGFVYVFDKDGSVLVRRYVDETVYSSPAVADLNGDGLLEIIVGTGYFWWNATGRTKTNYVYVFDTSSVFSALPYADPAKLPHAPGWPQVTPYPGFSSPAIADLDGDGDLEVVIAAGNPFIKTGDPIDGAGMVHAWHHDGAIVNGWPVSPRNELGMDSTIFGSPVIADIDNDGTLEVLIAMVWDIHVYNNNGTLRERLKTLYTVASTPAVGDTDGDGKTDVWIGGSHALEDPSSGYLWHFQSNQQLGAAPWPMFHRDSMLSGYYTMPRPAVLSTQVDNIYMLADVNNSTDLREVTTRLVLNNDGDVSLDWTAEFAGALRSMHQPDRLTLAPTFGTLRGGESATINVRISTAGLGEGVHQIGEIMINATSASIPLPTIIVPVEVYIGPVEYLHLPVIRR